MNASQIRCSPRRLDVSMAIIFRLVPRSYLFVPSRASDCILIFLHTTPDCHSFPLTRQQQALRQAILSSKQTIDRETKSERELLLKGSKSAIELSEIRRRGAGQGNDSEYMLNTSKEHNESLSRTLKLMQQEVERTAHSAKVIGKRDLLPQRLSLSLSNCTSSMYTN